MPSILSRIGAFLGIKAATDPNFSDPRFDVAEGPVYSPESLLSSTDIALKVSAWWGCVKVLSEAMASLPVKVYRTTKDGNREELPDHPLAARFGKGANAWQTGYELRETAMMALLSGGNTFMRQRLDLDGTVKALEPLDPATITIEQIKETGRLRFIVKPKDGSPSYILTQEEMFRVIGLTRNGITGLSVVSFAASSLALAHFSSVYGARLFANNASPAGVLKHPGVLGEEGRKNLRDGWEKVHKGVVNAGKIAILEEGMDYDAVGMSPKDSQFIELREFTVGDICRWFRVPPHMVFDLRRATFSNIEQQNLEFVQFTLLPWIRRWETAIARDLIDETVEPGVSVEFKVEGLLRGDTASRFNAYGIAIEKGWMNRNEVRALESMNKQEGLDDFLFPSNLSVVGEERPAPTAPGFPPKEPDPSKDPEQDPTKKNGNGTNGLKKDEAALVALGISIGRSRLPLG